MKREFYGENSYYEGLIQNFYAGAKGCFSAFMHFFYQYNQFCYFQPELVAPFKTLYMTELENCQILSEILLKMGGDNKYYSNSRKFLSGYNIDYVKTKGKIFLLNVEILEGHIIELKNLIDKIETVCVKQQLKEILANKKKELKILKEYYFKMNLI